MPFLDLTPETVSGARRSRLTLATIEAVMLWPDDEEHRKEYLAAAVAEHALAQVPSVVASDPVGAVESFSEMIAWAHSAPRISDFKKEISQRIRFGDISGILVIRSLLSPRYRGLTAIKKRISETKQFGRMGKTMINNGWAAFRPVAHLWAAHQIRYRHYVRDLHCDGYPFPCRLDDLEMFLATAEFFRVKGQSGNLKQYAGTGLHDGTVLRQDSWAVPDAIALPDVQLTVHA